jgi:hypothetical protein
MSDIPANTAENGVAGAPERLPNGQWAPGNKGAASANGVPKRMNKLRSQLLRDANVDSIREVLEKLRVVALEGDVAAMRLYLEYMIGKPFSAVQLIPAPGAPAEDAPPGQADLDQAAAELAVWRRSQTERLTALVGQVAEEIGS